ncbi:MAG: hypothetical protein RLZZ202_637, partial [Pseudomonadota bacterium]
MSSESHPLKNARSLACSDFLAHQNVGKLMQRLTQATDQQLLDLWNRCNLSTDAALLAVGGYGRSELFPYSDIDILILLDDARSTDPELQSNLESFIALCWDSGLEIGSAVRTLSECLSEAQHDITVRTSVLEARLLGGHRGLFKLFKRSFDEAMDPKTFFQAKLLEQQQRHYKYQETPYALEPNCKESPGGLRDLQIILWVSKAASLGNSYSDLFKRGLITERELKELSRNQKLLQNIRANLHLLAKRRQDVLVFDLQAGLAKQTGIHQESGRLASEELMRRYYWAAKAVSQLNTILLQNIEAILFPNESRTTYPISGSDNTMFIERQGLLDIVDPQLYQKHPEQILRTFLVFAQNPAINGLSASVFRALYNARQLMNASWRKDPRNRAVFMELLKLPDGVTTAFRLMNQTSVLGRYLPSFRRIVGQMQHDLFHVYTVDQHILMVLRNVRRFLILEHTHEFPFCSNLIASFDKNWIIA